MAATTTPSGLSRERIVQVALALVDRAGWQALSMRRLAQELDVWPMALYRYFHDKDELLGAVVAAAGERVALPTRSGPWRRRVAELLRDVRSAFGRSAGAIGSSRALLSPAGLRLTREGLRILEEEGLERQEATSAWRALFGYAVGFPVEREDDGPAELARQARAALAGVPGAEYAELIRLADELAAMAGDATQFEYGLDRLLDGVEATLRHRRRPARPVR